MKTLVLSVLALAAGSVLLAAEPPQRAAAKGRGATRTSTVVQCAADLGVGVASGRKLCDVIVAQKAAESVALTIPPRRGPAKLQFDLHNRIAVPPAGAQPAQMFSKNTATVAVVGPKSEIGRGVADAEFRKPADLFDRIGGGPGGQPKTVAPGPATPIEIVIPAGVSAVGVVGVRLKVVTRLGEQTYDTPGRPIAIVSNVRVEYTPLR
jgi:hypothetical protein